MGLLYAHCELKYFKIASPMNCPICGCSKVSLVESLEFHKILRCCSCEVEFADPFSAGSISYYSDHIVYSANSDEDLEDALRHCTSDYPYRVLKQIQSKKGTTRLRHLDVGCGTGSFVKASVNLGIDAHGVDFNAKQLARGGKYYRISDRLLEGDINAISSDISVKFDIISLLEVIEHVDQPLQLLQTVFDGLESGGTLIASLPDNNRFTLGKRIFVDYPPHHLTRWTEKSIRLALKDVGFSSIRIQPIGSLLDPLWTVYVNYSATRARIVTATNANSPQRKPLARFIATIKRPIYRALRRILRPLDWILHRLHISTMGLLVVATK